MGREDIEGGDGMDDGGRLLKSLPILLAAALLMGFFTACGNAALRFSGSDDPSEKEKRLKKLQKNPDVIIQTNLAVRTAAMIALAAVGYAYLYEPLRRISARYFDGAAQKAVFAALVILAVGFCAAVISAVGVSAPKKLCVSGRLGDGFALGIFPLYRALLAMFKPLRVCVFGITEGILRLFGVKSGGEEEQMTGEDILQLLDAADEIEDDQAEMISNIFEFSDLELHEVMTHRTELSAVEKTSPVSEAVAVSVETGFSRIPVYNETIDDICGVLYIKDMLPLIFDPEKKSAPVSEYMHKVKYVPESSSCSELFRYFTENKKQIAVALDEYGGTAGIVTMEDLLECIVGSIKDEYDENEAEEFEEITPNTFDILGGADPDDVMERLGHTLGEEHEYDTMGGFITDLLGYIPADGETPTVRYKDITFGVIKARDNRIEKLRAVKDRKKDIVMDEE